MSQDSCWKFSVLSWVVQYLPFMNYLCVLGKSVLVDGYFATHLFSENPRSIWKMSLSTSL